MDPTESSVTSRTPGALAILVVYYLKDDTELPLLRLHLDRIARPTDAPSTLFPAPNRLVMYGIVPPPCDQRKVMFGNRMAVFV